MEREMGAIEILKKPYARMVTPDEDGSYFSEIVEFPGCFATGATPNEALENLDSVAVDWIKTTIDQGQDIPEPMDASSYSGKLVLRMPKGLHKRAALWAEREGVSLNQFITACLAEAVGERAKQAVVVAQPHYQAVANVMLQLAVGYNGMAMMQGYPFPSSGANQQLTTGAGPAFVGVPLKSWRQQREREHG